MSKYDKFRARLCARPIPSDITWDELKGYLEHLGYKLLTGRGSRRKFFHREKNVLISCHEPHPKRIVDKGCLADVLELLKSHNQI